MSWHEKHRGQLFCDDSSESIIGLLRAECDEGRVAWRMGCSVAEIAHGEQGFELRTSQGLIRAAKLVVATGGMAIPQLGATDFGLKIARQFGLKIVEPRPALVPLTFDAAQWQPLSALSGVALEVSLSTGQGKARRIPRRPAVHASRAVGAGDFADFQLLEAGRAHRGGPGAGP